MYLGQDLPETVLARELHVAAQDLFNAKQSGDRAWIERAQAKMDAIAGAYTDTGKLRDDLELAKAKSPWLESVLSTVSQTAIVAAIVIGVILYASGKAGRRRDSY